MTKPSLLAASIAFASVTSVQAAPFTPLDARGMAMGHTGVASAQRAHAPTYNPSLLAQADENENFALLFPQLGIQVRDEEELASTAEDISDDLQPRLEDLINGTSGNSGFEQNIEQLDTAVRAFNQAFLDALNSSGNITQQLDNLEAANNGLTTALDNVEQSLEEVDSVSSELTEALRSISGNPVSGRLGVSGAMAFPGKSFAGAISMRGHATFSGRALFSDNDLGLIDAYAPAGLQYTRIAQEANEDVSRALDLARNSTTQPELILQSELNRDDNNNGQRDLEEQLDAILGFNYTSDQGVEIFRDGQLTDNASDPDLDSTVEVVALAVAEVGLSFAREFSIANRAVAIGVTPKIQRISTFHYVTEVDNEEDVEIDDIEDSREDYSSFNLDIGASMRFGELKRLTAGIVVKDILGGDYDYQDTEVRTGLNLPNPAIVKGDTISLSPQVRAGLSYSDGSTTLAVDLDLLENDPVAYENPTQFLAFGAEFDLWQTVQLRGGYRANLAATDSDIVSLGFGVSPFGIHLDLAVVANPSKLEKEAGVALETGFYF